MDHGHDERSVHPFVAMMPAGHELHGARDVRVALRRRDAVVAGVRGLGVVAGQGGAQLGRRLHHQQPDCLNAALLLGKCGATRRWL